MGERGGHAHKELHQIIIPITGSFDIHIDDGTKKKTIQLNQNNKGLYICPFIWRELDNFSQGAVCLVLASDFYKEDDYFRDYNVFVDFIRKL
jgi:dTDP-4-dehydrorhamnose 3,5-epimerase-like enzyme